MKKKNVEKYIKERSNVRQAAGIITYIFKPNLTYTENIQQCWDLSELRIESTIYISIVTHETLKR